MKHIKQLFGLAAVLGLASSGLAQTAEQPWFTLFDFEEQGLDIGTITNTTGFGGGIWAADVTDETTVTPDGGKSGTAGLLLNTQGNNLTFTPDVASTGTRVLIDADVYLVGSDSEPSGFDNSKDVQTAVYLKNETNDNGDTTNSVLCAYVAIDDSDNKWIELAGVTVADTNWYHLRIEIDYTDPDYPVSRYFINTTPMFAKADGVTESFPIANYANFTGGPAANSKVNSISFRGTGVIDNFAGWEVEEVAAATLNVLVTAFVNEQGIDISQLDVLDITLSTITAGANITGSILVPVVQSETISLIRLNHSSGYTYYDVDFDGVDYTSSVSGFITSVGGITIPTDAGWTGNVTLEVYYGTAPDSGAPTGQDPYFTPDGDQNKPVFKIGDKYDGTGLPTGTDPIEFNSEGNFVVNIVSAGSDVTYTLHKVTTLAASFDARDSLDDNIIITEVASETGVAKGLVVTLTDETAPTPNAFYKVRASW
jgi:hypothetical protein